MLSVYCASRSHMKEWTVHQHMNRSLQNTFNKNTSRKQHRIRLIEPVSAKPGSLEAQSHTKYERAFTLNKQMFLSFFLQRISIQASQENMFWIWKGSQRAQIWFSKMVSDLATFLANVSKAPLMMGLPVKNSDCSWQQLVVNMCFQVVEFNITIHRKLNSKEGNQTDRSWMIICWLELTVIAQ